MNLDELQSVQAKERQSSDLQHLRPSFYEEVGEFIEELRAERSKAVESAEDPFSKPAVGRLTNDIETATATVEAIYERRIGKVVKKASIAAADMPVEADGLTSEEQVLFETLVESIESNRENVLDVLSGKPESGGSRGEDQGDVVGDDSQAPDESIIRNADANSADPPERPAAADLMGTTDENATNVEDQDGSPTSVESDSPEGSSDVDPGKTPRSGTPEVDEVADETGDETEIETGDETEDETDGETARGSDGRSDSSDVPRTTVRITADVGRVVGTDDRDYHLGTDDVVTLPDPNAEVLLEKDAAKRID